MTAGLRRWQGSGPTTRFRPYAGGVVETDETVEVPADTVIAAVGGEGSGGIL